MSRGLRLQIGVSRALRTYCSTAATPKAGQLYIAGTGESNKLGVGDTKDRETPTLVESLQVSLLRACAFNFCIALAERLFFLRRTFRLRTSTAASTTPPQFQPTATSTCGVSATLGSSAWAHARPRRRLRPRWMR